MYAGSPFWACSVCTCMDVCIHEYASACMHGAREPLTAVGDRISEASEARGRDVEDSEKDPEEGVHGDDDQVLVELPLARLLNGVGVGVRVRPRVWVGPAACAGET